MSKLSTTLIALSLLAPLGACQQAKDPINAMIVVEYDDYEDYEEWKKERKEDAMAQPFKPALLEVSGTGTVKAAPDIAVITGTIKATGDFDHIVVNETAVITNKIQEIIAGQDVRLSFTRIAASEQRDPVCLRANAEARARHNQIRSDNWFNKRLLQNKDSKEKPRKDKPRIAQKVCPVTHIDGYVSFTAWVRPVEKAGDMLNDFTEAGATSVNLYGYDFSDYDALYKQASAMAVENAKAKAQLTAKTAGTSLTTLEQFYVDPPQRVSRYGPQAMVISNHGNRHVAAGRYRSTQEAVISPAPPPPPQPVVAPEPALRYGWDGSVTSEVADEVIVTASKSQPRDRFNRAGGGRNTAVTTRSRSPQSTGPTYAGNANNALRMTLLAGPQTVRVNASLGYLYETPLNGKIIIDDDD